jgi:hypothetical protein
VFFSLLRVSKAIIKRTRKRREHQTINSLLNDLLMEVFVKVASTSLHNLFNLKLSCKDFCELMEDDYIFQHVSLKKLLLVWCTKDEVLSFLKRCKENENLDALFRECIYGYFSSKNPKLGLEFLKKASKKIHIEASYLNLFWVPLKQQGFWLLSSLITSKLRGSRIKECRRRVKNCIRSMWINNNMIRDQESYCPEETCYNYGRTPNSLTAKRVGWLSNDYIENEDDEFMCCEYCRCHHEVHLFCNML